jgi:hypothetical protein
MLRFENRGKVVATRSAASITTRTTPSTGAFLREAWSRVDPLVPELGLRPFLAKRASDGGPAA